MGMKDYIIGGAIGLAIGIGTRCASDVFFKEAYTFRDDKDRNGQKELYLEKVDANKTYLIQEDAQGNITGISEFKGLELKLGEESPTKK